MTTRRPTPEEITAAQIQRAEDRARDRRHVRLLTVACPAAVLVLSVASYLTGMYVA